MLLPSAPYCPVLPRTAPYCPVLPRTAHISPFLSRAVGIHEGDVNGGKGGGGATCARTWTSFGFIHRERAMSDRRLSAATTAALRRSGTGVGGRTDLLLFAVGAESNLG